MKTTWNIIKTETGRKASNEVVQHLDVKGNTINNQQILANKFNDYFLTIADKITDMVELVKQNSQFTTIF
jgi:hypothetical protein